MMKRLWTRPDTRRETVATGIVLAAILVLALSGRTPGPQTLAPRAAGPPLSRTHVGPWNVDLARVEICPVRHLALCLVRVSGPILGGVNSPVDEVTAPGWRLDGGEWTGTTSAPITISFAGACGAGERFSLNAGEGMAVLRLRSDSSERQVALSFSFQGQSVHFPPAAPGSAPPTGSGLAGLIFGK